MTIHARLPENGFDGLRPTQIYERVLFTPEQLRELTKVWRMRAGTIQDPGKHQGVEVIQFIARREAK